MSLCLIQFLIVYSYFEDITIELTAICRNYSFILHLFGVCFIEWNIALLIDLFNVEHSYILFLYLKQLFCNSSEIKAKTEQNMYRNVWVVGKCLLKKYVGTGKCELNRIFEGEHELSKNAQSKSKIVLQALYNYLYNKRNSL